MIERPSHRYEQGLVALMIASVTLALAGMVFTNVGSGWPFAVGTLALVLAVLTAGGSGAMSYLIDKVHTIGPFRSGGDKYDQMRNWTRLKVSSILLQGLLVLGGIVLLAGMLARLGFFDGFGSFRGVAFGVSGLIFVTIVVMHASQALSLRMRIKHENPGLENALMIILLGGGGLLTLMGGLNALGAFRLSGIADGHRIDAQFFVLAGSVLSAVALFVGRNLPTLYALFYEERAYYKGKSYLSKTKSVIMPAMVAFSLLFLTVLFMLVFGLGIAGTMEKVQSNALVIGVLLFVVVLLGVSVAASFWLSRREDTAQVYKVKRTAEQKRQITLLGASLGVTTLLLVIAMVLFAGYEFLGLQQAWWLDFVTFAVLAGVGPFGFYVATQAARIRHLEERFPDFLRDIAASHKAGLPLATAVRIAANGEYGALTPEIRKMADQLTWNVAFSEVMHRFAKRVNTPLIHRSVNLMIEAASSGGNIVDVLNAAARDAREIKNLETERRQSMSLYTAVVYLTFFVFLTVVVLMYRTFISDLLAAAGQTLASGSSGFGGIQFSSLTLDDYRVFYFVAAIMQGLGNGIIAGLMGTGRVLLGLRHSFIMVALTYFVFKMIA